MRFIEGPLELPGVPEDFFLACSCKLVVERLGQALAGLVTLDVNIATILGRGPAGGSLEADFGPSCQVNSDWSDSRSGFECIGSGAALTRAVCEV